MNRVNFAGTQIGPYHVRERIGQGGMADVYRAYQPSVKREVALKVIPVVAGAESEVLEQRFTQEAEMIASLEHPHILPVFDYGVDGDALYLAMRLLRGGTLRDLLVRGPLVMEHAAELFGQIASALGYAHRRGIIHRDLKPSNILIDAEGNAYLADFGLAKVLGGTSQFTQTGAIIGTPAYMSPEQLRGDPFDLRADVYSLGVILYHMIVGRPPFEALTTFSLVYQHVEKPPPPPREFNPEIPQAVEGVVLCALEKKPDNRFDSATTMAVAFNLALGRRVSPEPLDLASPPQEPPVVVQTTTPTPAERDTPTLSVSDSVHPAVPIRRVPRTVWLGLLAVILAILAGLASVWLAQPGRTFPTPVVMTGVQGTWEDVLPAAAEIALAAQHLGAEGFIAYIACNQESEFFAGQARRMADLAQQYGLRFRVYDSETDVNRQIVQIERARAAGARALIVCIVDAGLLMDILMPIGEADIPFVLHNISEPPEVSDHGVLVTPDNFLLGLAPGRYAGLLVAEQLDGQADVVILDFPELPSIVLRADGLEAGLLEHAPRARVIGRYLGGTRAAGHRSISALIEAGVHFDVILSINDAGAYGAIDALAEAGFEPDSVIVTGVDAEILARQYIREGYFLRASVDVGAEELSHGSLNAVVKLLAGSTVPQVILTEPGDLITGQASAGER